MSSNANKNKPGRLPSFRGERDLTLGGNSKSNSASATDKGDVKPKREFKPTIPARRTKPQEAPLNVDRVTESPSNGRGRGRGRDDRGRGRGRGRPELIQTQGSIFGEGISDLGLKMRNASSAAYSDREGGAGSSGAMEKPRLSNNNTKVNQEEEEAALKNLLRDNFIDDSAYDDFDENMVVQPIQLPKTSLDASVKKESNVVDIKSESMPEIKTEDGVIIKQEKVESKPIPTPKVSQHQRRLKPAQVTGEQIFQNEGEILFIQLPNVLPSLKSEKDERPQVKTEPGTSIQEKNDGQSISEVKPEKEGVFDDIPEGRLGTLRIHKSGKITLQLGENSFVLDSATQVSFIQDLVSIEVDEENKSGKMKALGPIKYKTVCLPDWDELIVDS